MAFDYDESEPNSSCEQTVQNFVANFFPDFNTPLDEIKQQNIEITKNPAASEKFMQNFFPGILQK